MSGLYWHTTDIGGYANGNITSPDFRELLVRWMQFGAFCPLMRLHGERLPAEPPSATCGGSGGANEPWVFGDEAYEIIKGLINLRESLRGYVTP